MKKLFLILIAATFSLQMYSAPVLAKKETPADLAARRAAHIQINALKQLLKHTKDPVLRAQIAAQIKLIKISAFS
ncbi:MAG: hypothetical protein HY268_09190 [Deltaproteobacteria bacterium]|nr:hypothetical protein [Deltaproteobacteria bacterium]